MTQDAAHNLNPELSIVVPAFNEQDNVDLLVAEIAAAVTALDIELIIVDDGSTDQTLQRLRHLNGEHRALRVLSRPKALGKSAALQAGIRVAAGPWLGTLDADLQNDPTDLPRMLEAAKTDQLDLVHGIRTRRRDNVVRRCSTWVGRMTRRLLLGDSTVDTGCGISLIRTDLARRIPFHFAGMHRFVPAFARMLGARVAEMEVNHRPRAAGVSKYGVRNRAVVGFFDCLAMRWMLRRYRDAAAAPVEGHEAD